MSVASAIAVYAVPFSQVHHFYYLVLVMGVMAQKIEHSPSRNGVEGNTHTLSCVAEIPSSGAFWRRLNDSASIILGEYAGCAVNPKWKNFYGITCSENSPESSESRFVLLIQNVDTNMQASIWQCDLGSRKLNTTFDVYVPDAVKTVEMKPSSGIVIAGKPAKFNCKTSESRPKACINWYKIVVSELNLTTHSDTATCNPSDGPPVETISELTYTFERQDQGNVLKCTAGNFANEGTLPSASVTLNVIFGPALGSGSLVSSPPKTEGNVSVISGNTIHLTCSSEDSKPPSTLEWSFNSKTVSVGLGDVQHISGPYGARITKQQYNRLVSKGDNQKMVTCIISYEGSTITSLQIKLNVEFDPTPKSGTLVSDQEEATGVVSVITETTVLFTCSTMESNPSQVIKWLFSSQEVLSGQAQTQHIKGANNGHNTTQQYTRRVSKKDHEKTVQCIIYYKEDRITALEKKLNILYPPTMNCSKKVTITEGQGANMSCESESNPGSNFTWWFGGRAISDYATQVRSSYLRVSILTLMNTNRTHNGTYTVNATNKIGMDVSEHIQLIVLYPPTVTVSGPDYGIQGGSLKLLCSADGVPDRYTFSKWIHSYDGHTIRKLPADARLSISRLQFEDKGEYTCRVSNNIKGTQTGSHSLNIRAPPVFSVEPGIFTATIGQNITVYVEFTSFPDVLRITWTKVDNSSEYLVNITNVTLPFTFHSIKVSVPGQKAEIMLQNVQPRDFGYYNVTISNAIGVVNFTVEVKPHGPPCPPEDFSSYCTNIVALYWTSCFDGGLEQEFVLEYKTDENIWEEYHQKTGDSGEGMNISINLNDLDHDKGYTFRVRGHNSEGYSAYSAETSCTTTSVSKEQLMENSPVAAIAAASSVAVVLAMALVIVLIIRRRRMQTTKGKESYQGGVIDNGYSDSPGFGTTGALESPYELEDTTERNGAVIGPVYADVNKTKTGALAGAAIGPVYTDVKKTKTGALAEYCHDFEGGPVCSRENKPKSGRPKFEIAGPIYADVDKSGSGKNAKKKGAAGPVYAEVNKAKTQSPLPDSKVTGPVYAEVDKTGSEKDAKKKASAPTYADVHKTKPGEKPSSFNATGPVYADVVKPKPGDQAEKGKGKGKKGDKKRLVIRSQKQAKGKGPKRGNEQAYENATFERELDEDKNLQVQENDAEMQDKVLVYADMDFGGIPDSPVNPTTDTTEYAFIDYTKKGVPEETEEEEEK